MPMSTGPRTSAISPTAREGSHGKTRMRLGTIDSDDEQGGHQKRKPNAHDYGSKNKHGHSFGKCKHNHGNRAQNKAWQYEPFLAVKVHYPRPENCPKISITA